MGIIYYDVAAIIINLINLFIFSTRSRLYNPQTKVMATLLYISLFTTVLDIVTVVTNTYGTSYPLAFHHIVNVLYFLGQNSITPVFFLFVLTLGVRPPTTPALRKILSYLPWLCSIAIIVTSPVTGLVYLIDPVSGYSRGPGQYILYGVVLIYIVLTLISLLSQRKRVDLATRTAVYFFLFVPFGPAIIQFINPDLLVQNFGIAIAESIILLTVQDFGRYIYQGGSLYNQDGLSAQVGLLHRTRTPFTLYLISLAGGDYLRRALGPVRYHNLEQKIATDLFLPQKPERFAAQFTSGNFALILPVRKGTTHPSARTHDELLRYFNSPVHLEDRDIMVVANICEINFPEETEDTRQIFHAYGQLRRKESPGNTSRIYRFSDLPLSDTQRRIDVAQAVWRALDSDGFELHFQPIVDVESNAVVSAEALIRLHDPQLGSISPGEFIPISEGNGSINAIGSYVMEEACRFLKHLRQSGFRLDYMEINISTLQCIQPDITTSLLRAVQRHGLSPRDICPEITETAAALFPDLMKENIGGTAKMGFPVAIDDFGTGYSNIGVLLDFPIRLIKLDRSLIIRMKQSGTVYNGVRELLSTFRGMKIPVVAEGVETQDQLDLVRSLGISLVQGYYFSRALSRDDFLSFLAKQDITCT